MTKMSSTNIIHTDKVVFEEDDPDSGLVEDAFDVLPDEQTLPFDEINFDFNFDEDNFGRCSTGEDFSDLLELDGLDTSLTELEDNAFAFDVDEKNTNTINKYTTSLSSNNYTETGEEENQYQKKTSIISNNIESDHRQLQQSFQEHNEISDKQYSNHCENSLNQDSEVEISHDTYKPTTTTTSTNNNQNNINGGKLVSFSKEQARQWRRKRILNSCNKKEKKLPVSVIGLKHDKLQKSSSLKCPLKLEPLLPLPKDLKPIAPSKLKSFNEKHNSKEKLENPLLGGERLGTRTKRGMYKDYCL